MSAESPTSPELKARPDGNWSSSGWTGESLPVGQFRNALALYVGWSFLAWLSSIAGIATIAPQTAAILLFGAVATNALFFLVTRSDALQHSPTETIALAQSVVGIAWTTLLAALSNGTGALIFGIYVSILLFALLRVSRSVLNQIAVFAVASYTVTSIFKALSTESGSLSTLLSAANLVPLLIFAVTMLYLCSAGRRVYRRHLLLEAELAGVQDQLRRDHAGGDANSVNRRYILDMLAREKGRTDRSNVSFCVCAFTVVADEQDRKQALKSVEATIRDELRGMDSLNSTGFHECFGPYADKEYIAILPQTNLRGAQQSAERILTSIATLHETGAARVELCGGIAEYHRGETIAVLLARAEEALGKARSSGVSRICCGNGGSADTEVRYADVVRLESRRK